MGPSGSGKSTLMHCMAGLDTPTSGRTFIGDQEIGAARRRRPDPAAPGPRSASSSSRSTWCPPSPRPRTSPCPPTWPARKVDQAWFDYLVDQLGIGDRLSHRPSEMSGGQQQRVACARALIGRPDLIFADEPTGNLDSNSSTEMLDFLRRSVTEFDQSIVMVTHDPRGAAYADRVVFLADGRGRRRAGLAHRRLGPRADEAAGQLRCGRSP